jgi:hypothetical protein
MNAPLDRVPIAYCPPFGSGDLYVDQRRPGGSILDIVRSVPNLPAHFERAGYVCINGEIVPRHMWAYVRPKPTRTDSYVSVTLHFALGSPGGGQGGGRSTTKSIIGIVAAIALIVVTQGIASGALFGTLGTIGFGITGAQVLAGAVGIAGALAISALTAPPTQTSNDAGGSNVDNAEPASAQGNILDKGGAVPRVLGTRKIFPPLACEPVVELVGQDEYVEALYILNGPHALSDIRIDGNTIASADDVTLETREGWPTDTAISSISRQGKTSIPQIEMSTHSVLPNGIILVHPLTPLEDIPVWHGMASRNDPEELWIHMLLPGGIALSTGTGSSGNMRIPFRCRIRRRGSVSWINVPEFHLTMNSSNQYRGAVVFKFGVAWPGAPQPPVNFGFDYAHAKPPIQTLSPTSIETWIADASFYTSGQAFVMNGSLGAVSNISLYDNRVEIYITIPGSGAYEVEMKRGFAFVDSDFSKPTYAYTGSVYDFFFYFIDGAHGSVPAIRFTQNNVSHRVVLARVVSIWNDPPLSTPGNFALIAIRALNRAVRQVSCTASGYVKDWTGSDWTTPYVTTSNPAPHYVDVLQGSLNLDPLPTDLRGDGRLVQWRTLCSTNGWTCDAIINDMRTQDVLSLLASCGYAKPYQSDRYSVAVDYDKSAEAPIQVFSRRNCANLRYEKAFARAPAGFNVTYRDEAQDDDQAQVAVYQTDPANSDMTLLEAVSYDGIIDVAKVTARAKFDLDQANLRSTFYYLDVDIESIVAFRGSLVAVEHDILATRAGDGYIVSKQTSGGNITGITLDAEIPIVFGTTGIVIRRTDGTLSTHALSNSGPSASVLTFSTPIADTATIQGFVDNDRKYGCLVVAGDLTTIYRRLLVHSITPQANLMAQMVLVDEAQGLVRYAP